MTRRCAKGASTAGERTESHDTAPGGLRSCDSDSLGGDAASENLLDSLHACSRTVFQPAICTCSKRAGREAPGVTLEHAPLNKLHCMQSSLESTYRWNRSLSARANVIGYLWLGSGEVESPMLPMLPPRGPSEAPKKRGLPPAPALNAAESASIFEAPASLPPLLTEGWLPCTCCCTNRCGSSGPAAHADIARVDGAALQLRVRADFIELPL